MSFFVRGLAFVGVDLARELQQTSLDLSVGKQRIGQLEREVQFLSGQLDSKNEEATRAWTAAKQVADEFDAYRTAIERTILRSGIDANEANLEELRALETTLTVTLARLIELEKSLTTPEQRRATQTSIAIPEQPESTPETPIETVSVVDWEIVGLWFVDRRFWTVRRPGEKEQFTVPIKDPKFLTSLHSRQVLFGDGDILRTTTRSILARVGGQRKATHVILEILQIINRPAQIALGEAADTTAQGARS
jgi:hypothetical protein